MDNTEIVITSAFRTAIGSFGKSLKILQLMIWVQKLLESLLNLKIKSKEVDDNYYGSSSNRWMGQNPARQAAIKSGIPKEKPAYIVNQVCGSGIRSVASGFQSIKSGDSKLVIAGGQENMSLAPHAIHLRDGKKLGDTALIDTMIKMVYGMLFMGIIWVLQLKMLLKNFK